jgi:hypothetical protein
MQSTTIAHNLSSMHGQLPQQLYLSKKTPIHVQDNTWQYGTAFDLYQI